MGTSDAFSYIECTLTATGAFGAFDNRVKRRKEEGDQLVENPLHNFLGPTTAKPQAPAAAVAPVSSKPSAGGRVEKPGYSKVCGMGDGNARAVLVNNLSVVDRRNG